MKQRSWPSRKKRRADNEKIQRREKSTAISLFPYSLWAAFFIVVPMIFVGFYAFTDNDFNFTLENIERFFASVSTVINDDGSTRQVHTYLLILMRSLKLAVISTVVCLIIGYPLAYRIAHAKKNTQKTMMTLIMIPMWMNFLIRTYAWMTILQDAGIMNSIIERIGMVYDYLPYMVLPIYAIMVKLDPALLEASKDLGCTPLSAFFKVELPEMLPGVITGVIMAFTMSLDDFVISYFTSGTGFETLPIRIYSMTKKTVTPNMYALATIIFFVTLSLLLISNFIDIDKDSKKTKNKD